MAYGRGITRLNAFYDSYGGKDFGATLLFLKPEKNLNTNFRGYSLANLAIIVPLGTRSNCNEQKAVQVEKSGVYHKNSKCTFHCFIDGRKITPDGIFEQNVYLTYINSILVIRTESFSVLLLLYIN
ncbi:hypothetical protein CW304_32555 [Bacillus sp. UFRGS-B20]|nr:hypothetical protein CW304_32555 [Bacillus sp. UFRGS-B20]